MAKSISLIILLFAAAGCSVPQVKQTKCLPCSNQHYKMPVPIEHCELQVPDQGSQIRNLVFQGGGVKGIAYGGALVELGKHIDLDKVERVAGTSAGAITAAMVAVGYNACTISEYMMTFPFEKLADGSFLGDASHFVGTYGWHPGNYFQCTMECVVAQQLGSKDASFGMLSELAENSPTYKDLSVVATNLNTGLAEVFSSVNHATMAIADAVRLSMSIPLFFEARKAGRDTYVDGGVVLNYAIDLFDDKAACSAEMPDCNRQETLGLHLRDKRKSHYAVNDIGQYAERLANSLLNAQVVQLCDNQNDIARTIFIDTGNVTAEEFDLSQMAKLELLAAGKSCTKKYFKQPTPTKCPSFVTGGDDHQKNCAHSASADSQVEDE